MYNDGIMNLIGKDVLVTSSGMDYRGKLIEVSETDVYLQGEMGWIQLTVESVTDIRLVE